MARHPNFLSGSCALLAAVVALFTALPPPVAGAASSAGAALTAGTASNASTLYKEALATTTAWRVHYVSTSDVAKVPFFESGNAGPASGTQTIRIGEGATLDSASLIVIGDLTYVKGNQHALEDLTGLSSTEAATEMGRWVLFSTNNPTFSQVVAGVRSHDVAQEVALQGALTLGPSRKLQGYQVDALQGMQTFQGAKKMKAVLYVRASGRHVLVEEDTVNARGISNGAEHIVFSKWGEKVRPKAPTASVTLGSVNAT